MSSWFMVARALPLTFLVYVVHACAAWVAGLAPALELTRNLPSAMRPLSRAVWLEQFLASAAMLRVSAITLALTCALLLLVSPALHMAWLVALDAPTSVLRSLAQGTRLWLRAMLVSLWVLLGFAVAALPFGLLAWGIARLLGDHPNERVRDLALLGALLPLLPLAWFGHSWHDLARARALHHHASFQSTFGSLRDALRPTIQRSALAWSALGFGAVLLTHWGAAQLPISALARVGLLQAGVLLRLVLRSRWLARAVACAPATPESAAWHEK